MAEILYGIQRVVINELDPKTQLPLVNGVRCLMETAESAELAPILSEGTENIARSDKKILAVVRTPDLLYGYDVTYTDNTFDTVFNAIVSGAKLIKDESGTVTGFADAMMYEGNTLKPFNMEIYIANYEGDSIKNYVRMTLNNCSGKAPKMSIAKEFYAPEFEIKAREATKAGLPSRTIDFVDELPEILSTLCQVLKTTVGSLNVNSIASIPKTTTAKTLTDGLTVSPKATIKIVDADGANVTDSTVLLSTHKLVVTAEDTKTTHSYTLTVLAV